MAAFFRTALGKSLALGGTAAVCGTAALFGGGPKKVDAPAQTKQLAARDAYQRFTADNDFPELSKHNNCLANHLTKELYSKLRDVVSNQL